MQIISPPEARPTRLNDYLQCGTLVVCAEAGARSVTFQTDAKEHTGDGAPFLLLFEPTLGYTALLTLVAGQIDCGEEGVKFRLAQPTEEIAPVAVAARAAEPHTAIHRALEQALRVTGSLGKLLIDKPPLPRRLDRAGWVCNQPTSHADILAALDALPFAPGFVLLRGWSDTDPEQLPSGLRGLSHALKERGIPHMGITHGLMEQTGTDLGAAFQFFYDFYAHLKAEGVTFVEVDHTQPASSARNVAVAIQAAASIQFNSVQFNRHCLSTEHLFQWTTTRLASTDGGWAEHLRAALWLQHLMVPVPPPPTDETTAMLNALSASPLLIEGDGAHLDQLLLPSGRTLKTNAPLTLTDDSLFAAPDRLKGFTYKAGCGIVAAFGGGVEVSATDFGGGGRSYAVHSYRRGYLGRVDAPLATDQSDIFTFAPIINGIGLLGHPHFFCVPGPIQEMHRDEESIHISSEVTGPLLLYCDRDPLEIRCNGQIVPWGRERATGSLLICEGRELIEQPSLYTLTFES